MNNDGPIETFIQELKEKLWQAEAERDKLVAQVEELKVRANVAELAKIQMGAEAHCLRKWQIQTQRLLERAKECILWPGFQCGRRDMETVDAIDAALRPEEAPHD